MQLFTSLGDQKIINLLMAGGIGVFRTDTLYGVVAKADNEAAVRRVYELKERSEHKSPIVLVSSRLQLFDVPGPEMEAVLADIWPGPVSVILPSRSAPLWIRRGNASVAYRLPAHAGLQSLVAATGPLIAPSANPQGLPPAMNIHQAQAYFGDAVDFYVDDGEVPANTPPSQLLRVSGTGRVERLR